MLDSSSYQEGDGRSAKSRDRGGESKGARAALGWILLRQPERIDGKIRATESEKEKTNEEPSERGGAKIENFAKRQGDEGQHQNKIRCKCAAPPEFFREPGHRETAQNRTKRNEHGRSRSELRCRRSDSSACLGKNRDRRGNVD